MCSPHFVSLDFVNDVEDYWLRKETSHQQDCCPNHVSIKTRGFATLTQSAAGRRGSARPSSRAGQRTAHASKQVFVNKNTGASLIWITTLNTYVICQTVRHDAHVYETSETMCGQSGKSQTSWCRSSTESLLSESAIARPI